MSQAVRLVVKCPDCVEVRVGTDDVTVRRCVDDDSWSYRFTCPVCLRRTVSPTDAVAGSNAVDAGCQLETWHRPAELLEHHEGPPLTLADLFTLQELLLEADWFETFVRAGECP